MNNSRVISVRPGACYLMRYGYIGSMRTRPGRRDEFTRQQLTVVGGLGVPAG